MMAYISLGQVNLTDKQINRLSEAHTNEVKGFKYKGGELTVNHLNDNISDSEKQTIIASVQAIPDDDTQEQKDMKAIKDKPDQSITTHDLVKILRAKGIL